MVDCARDAADEEECGETRLRICLMSNLNAWLLQMSAVQRRSLNAKPTEFVFRTGIPFVTSNLMKQSQHFLIPGGSAMARLTARMEVTRPTAVFRSSPSAREPTCGDARAAESASI